MRPPPVGDHLPAGPAPGSLDHLSFFGPVEQSYWRPRSRTLPATLIPDSELDVTPVTLVAPAARYTFPTHTPYRSLFLAAVRKDICR